MSLYLFIASLGLIELYSTVVACKWIYFSNDEEPKYNIPILLVYTHDDTWMLPLIG